MNAVSVFLDLQTNGSTKKISRADKMKLISDPKSIKCFPSSVQKDMSITCTKATKATLEAIQEYKADKADDLGKNESRLKQLTNKHIISNFELG